MDNKGNCYIYMSEFALKSCIYRIIKVKITFTTNFKTFVEPYSGLWTMEKLHLWFINKLRNYTHEKQSCLCHGIFQ
jgi:hypothetical protein